MVPTIVQYEGVTAEYHHDLPLRPPHTSTTFNIKLCRHHLLFTFKLNTQRQAQYELFIATPLGEVTQESAYKSSSFNNISLHIH